MNHWRRSACDGIGFVFRDFHLLSHQPRSGLEHAMLWENTLRWDSRDGIIGAGEQGDSGRTSLINLVFFSFPFCYVTLRFFDTALFVLFCFWRGV